MKKMLLTILVSISAMAPVLPCDQYSNIKKAFVIVQSVLRHSEREFVCPYEAEHALQVYYKEFRLACEDCKQLATFEYNQFILKLERLLEESER